ncbi:hypothetical protein G5S_0801 [Chlamydia pecorum E58]|uniref:Uncharacterized protein n=1 Tax=Chlamydia pecorum (strain ATCC VR-628 / DSM 29919 / E58) TaxID=331635 RepID=A0AA34WI97_CHLPE|nr:hypothetical protein G5S_0801 [Chlamydia pecorum E58]
MHISCTSPPPLFSYFWFFYAESLSLCVFFYLFICVLGFCFSFVLSRFF